MQMESIDVNSKLFNVSVRSRKTMTIVIAVLCVLIVTVSAFATQYVRNTANTDVRHIEQEFSPDARLQLIEQRMGDFEKKVDAIDVKLDGVQTSVDRILGAMDALRNNSREGEK